MPRFEICGAHLAAKLLEQTKVILELTGINLVCYAWTDSTITLQWLVQLPRIWNTFVDNRDSFIQEVMKQNFWNQVPTKCNSADLASR